MPEPPGGLFVEHQAVIEAVIRFVCRRRGLRADEADDFAADVRLRLVESNYDVLRKFQGRSSLQTYLTVVVQRMALDYRAARWGRWRPSAVARAEGADGVRLEQLVVRDGLGLDDALAVVERESEKTIDRPRLEALAARFPMRTRREYVGEELLELAAADTPDAERLLVRAEEESRFTRVKSRLADILATLEPADRLLLQLRFEKGMKIADIARMQGSDQKRLYRRVQDTLKELRTILESEGIDASAVRQMLAELAPDDSATKSGEPVRLYEGTRHEH